MSRVPVPPKGFTECEPGISGQSRHGWLGVRSVDEFSIRLLLALYAGLGPAVCCELFPASIRYAALSVGYDIPVAISGGFAPLIAAWLIQLTGAPLFPAFYVIAASPVTLVTTAWVKETALEPLP